MMVGFGSNSGGSSALRGDVAYDRTSESEDVYHPGGGARAPSAQLADSPTEPVRAAFVQAAFSRLAQDIAKDAESSEQEDDGELVADLVGGLRLGLDHRITPHWTLGASIGATYCMGLGAPDLQIVDGAISISYV